MRGRLYAQHGDFARAINDFDEAIRLNPKDAAALNNRCWTHAVVGELRAALRDCEEALQMRPLDVDALDSRGFVKLKMGQLKDAISDYDAALRIRPNHASSLYGRGVAKIRIGNATGGNGDIAAAKLVQTNIVDEFARWRPLTCAPPYCRIARRRRATIPRSMSNQRARRAGAASLARGQDFVVRLDQYIAWRGDQPPENCDALIARVTGQ